MPEKKVIELNILGQVCPACLLVALNELNVQSKKLKKGSAELVIRTDHRDATRTIPESARAMGFEVDVKKVETYYEIRVNGRT
ncbi:MAG: sulfurtransferase TusA family protein [Nitrospiraceae bacterium]|nr:sulfurtransferase TusA family protein [Nitrospiraceae bacterium]